LTLIKFFWIILVTLNFLKADDLVCKDIYTTITEFKKNNPIKVTKAKGHQNTTILIRFDKKNIFLITKNSKTKLLLISKSPYTIYLLEKTPIGNTNLFSIHTNDLILTISKSYFDPIFGQLEVNSQTIWKCVYKK
jgi:hypothetical protein